MSWINGVTDGILDSFGHNDSLFVKEALIN